MSSQQKTFNQIKLWPSHWSCACSGTDGDTAGSCEESSAEKVFFYRTDESRRVKKVHCFLAALNAAATEQEGRVEQVITHETDHWPGA